MSIGPIPETNALIEPHEKVTKEQVRFLLECGSLVLCKIGHVEPPSFEEVSSIADELFGDDEEEPDDASGDIDQVRKKKPPADDSTVSLSWAAVKLCLQCNSKIITFLSPYVEVINIFDSIDDINDVMKEISDEVYCLLVYAFGYYVLQ